MYDLTIQVCVILAGGLGLHQRLAALDINRSAEFNRRKGGVLIGKAVPTTGLSDAGFKET